MFCMYVLWEDEHEAQKVDNLTEQEAADLVEQYLAEGAEELTVYRKDPM